MRAGEGLWAIGDVTGKGAFTHVSMYQSAICVRDILGQDGPAADYRALPHVTFTDPEVGWVGMTEKQARDAGLTSASGTPTWPPPRAAGSPGQGLIKLVEDADRGSSSARPRSDPAAARCSRCSRPPCTPRCRRTRCAR